VRALMPFFLMILVITIMVLFIPQLSLGLNSIFFP
jgi:TRAP-type C4-dicarboxylate transport system permease large subunit